MKEWQWTSARRSIGSWRLSCRRLVGGGPLLLCGVVVVDELLLNAGAGCGGRPRSASATFAAVGAGMVGARCDHGDDEVGDAKNKAPHLARQMSERFVWKVIPQKLSSNKRGLAS